MLYFLEQGSRLSVRAGHNIYLHCNRTGTGADESGKSEGHINSHGLYSQSHHHVLSNSIWGQGSGVKQRGIELGLRKQIHMCIHFLLANLWPSSLTYLGIRGPATTQKLRHEVGTISSSNILSINSSKLYWKPLQTTMDKEGRLQNQKSGFGAKIITNIAKLMLYGGGRKSRFIGIHKIKFK